MDHAPLTSVLPTLPARWYQDAEHHRREMRGKDAGGRFVRTSSGHPSTSGHHQASDTIGAVRLSDWDLRHVTVPG